MQMGGGRFFVLVTTQAVHSALVGVLNDHFHSGSGGGERIDVTVGVMALKTATGFMYGQDLGKVANRVAVGAGLVVALAAVGGRVDLDSMIDSATGCAMVVAIKIGGVAGNALSAAGYRRGNQGPVAGGIVAGGTPLGSMDFTRTDKWSGCGSMAADTVGGERSDGYVFLYLGGVAVVMIIEVAGMAINACPAVTAIDPCVSIAVDAGDQGAVGI